MKLEDLYKKYPVIFSEERGFEHNHGWYKLLDELCSQLITIMDKVGVVITAEQVKEKFGTLRFYYSLDFKDLPESDAKDWYRIIASLVSKAEMQSGYTCERCGERGKMRPGGWIKTLCDECDSNSRRDTEIKEWTKTLSDKRKEAKEASDE